MLSESQKELAISILESGAVQFGQFKLKLHERNPSAPLSPVYVDLRLIRSSPKAFRVAIAAYEEMLRSVKCDLYADVPTAVTPFVGALILTTGIAMVSPRMNVKVHGLGRQIDGRFRAGQVVAVLDDLITRADSKLEAIASLEAAGLTVRDVIVLVDREQGGREELERRGYRCVSALALTAMLAFYRDEGLISLEQFARTEAYLAEGTT